MLQNLNLLCYLIEVKNDGWYLLFFCFGGGGVAYHRNASVSDMAVLVTSGIFRWDVKAH